MSDNEITLMTPEKAALLTSAIRTLELCDLAIAEYKAAGISGTVHDVEHREMREQAWRSFKDLTGSV